MAVRARPKRFEYAVSVDRDGRFRADGEDVLELAPGWTAEHLVLAGLVRCSLTALAYHAQQLGIDIRADGEADATVTRRESDGRYAFVEIECRLNVETDGDVDTAALADLLARAERNCFIGASLQPPPRYRWRVNGEERG